MTIRERRATREDHPHTSFTGRHKERFTEYCDGLMRYRDLVRATRTRVKAFEGDMILVYVYNADTNPFAETRRQLMDAATWAGAIYQKRMLTIDAGDSLLFFATPESKTPPGALGLFQKLLVPLQSKEVSTVQGTIHTYMVDIGQSCESSDVFRKRLDDLKAVMVAMLISAFGALDKVRDMYDVQGLGVSPEKHGRGYGTILMRVMLATSDAEGRDSFVFTGTAQKFYAKLGYNVVAKGTLGEDNPAWQNEPVEITLMHRPAQVQIS